MTTTWKIKKIERQIPEGLVIKVTYSCLSEEGKYINRKIDRVVLEGDVNAPDFIPYEDLTEEIVLGWVTTHLGEEKVAEIQAEVEGFITSRIAEEAAKTTETGLPW